MKADDILNMKSFPKTNKQIQKSSPKKRAMAIAYKFMYENISNDVRSFDNLWENGRSDEIQKEFSLLYLSIPELRIACRTKNAAFFSDSMIDGIHKNVNEIFHNSIIGI